MSGARLAWTAAFLAWLLAVPLYLVTRFVATVAHEGGHAIIATLLFQKVRSIKLNRDSSGGTNVGDPPWLFAIPIALAGYLGPSMFGLLAAFLLIRGMTDAVLWGSLGFLLLMLIVVRTPFGWFLVPALIVAIFWVATKVPPPNRVLLTQVWVWLLLIVPVEDMLVFMRGGGYRDPGADTSRMRRLTLLPGALWGVVLLGGTVAALVYGGDLLLHHAG
jgi:Peptidase M50B-like